MQKIIYTLVVFISVQNTTNAQWFEKIKEAVEKTVKQNQPNQTNKTTVTEDEAAQGIKQALNQGVNNAIKFLNKPDGFFKSEIYKLLLPPDVQKAANTLKKIGLNKQVDEAVLSINRAAEDAVGYAAPIFVSAIKQITLKDVFNILKGSKNAATNYFREKTSDSLKAAFLPTIRTSLDKVGATKYYGKIITAYNNVPFIKKINPDLPAYVTDKATFALFDQIEKEEANIRQNPLARTTDLLKKVFGML